MNLDACQHGVPGVVIGRNHHQARAAQFQHLPGNLCQGHIRQVRIQQHQVKRQAGQAGLHLAPGLNQADAVVTGFLEADTQ